MELILNLIWAVLALVSICLWARVAYRQRSERLMPFVALLMLIVMMFPVISVSDDLWSIQNPAETDSIQRRDHLSSPAHSIFPALATLCEVSLAEMSFGFGHCPAPAYPATPEPTMPPPARIQNRPPPAA